MYLDNLDDKKCKYTWPHTVRTYIQLLAYYRLQRMLSSSIAILLKGSGEAAKFMIKFHRDFIYT